MQASLDLGEFPHIYIDNSHSHIHEMAVILFSSCKEGRLGKRRRIREFKTCTNLLLKGENLYKVLMFLMTFSLYFSILLKVTSEINQYTDTKIVF